MITILAILLGFVVVTTLMRATDKVLARRLVPADLSARTARRVD
ncbi:MAG TPA: hypothetical protein VFM08_11680 [Nocardioides sp.]|jgi:hypothetical protein|nr:hypothetical protein [Nocardioides sp.]